MTLSNPSEPVEIEATQFDFKDGMSRFFHRAENRQSIAKEFKRLVRAQHWSKAALCAKGVQSHMEFTLLGMKAGFPPEFIEVSNKLKTLILDNRIITTELNGSPWYFLRAEAELAVTRGGYNVDIQSDFEKEPLPFGEPIPWDKLMLDDAEFPRELKDMPEWLRKRI